MLKSNEFLGIDCCKIVEREIEALDPLQKRDCCKIEAPQFDPLQALESYSSLLSAAAFARRLLSSGKAAEMKREAAKSAMRTVV